MHKKRFDYLNFTLEQYRKEFLSRVAFIAISAVLLAGTDLFLSFNKENCKVPANGLWCGNTIIDWLTSTHILAGLAVSIVAALVLYYFLERILTGGVIAVSIQNVVESGALEEIIPTRFVPRIFEALIRTISNNDETYTECQSRVFEHYQKRYEEDQNTIIRDLGYNFVIRPLGSVIDISSHELYFHIQGTVKYDRRTLPDSLVLKGLKSLGDDNSKIYDPNAEFVWNIVIDDFSDSDVLNKCFTIDEVRINGQLVGNDKVKLKSGNVSNGNGDPITYHIDIKKERESLKNKPFEYDEFPYLVEIMFSAIQEKKYGFVAANCKYHSRNFSVSVDYKEADFIQAVWGVNHVCGSEYSSKDRTGTDGIFKVKHYGWIIPESGVTVSWSNQAMIADQVRSKSTTSRTKRSTAKK